MQSLIDGELSARQSRRVVSHLSCCASCAKAERAARLEDDVLTSLFARDGFVAVPTERLWAGIAATLGEARRAARCEQ